MHFFSNKMSEAHTRRMRFVRSLFAHVTMSLRSRRRRSISSSSSGGSSHTSGSNSASPFFTISASSHHAVRTPARRLRMRTLGLRALGAAELRGCHRAARVCGRTFTLPLMYQPFCRIILTCQQVRVLGSQYKVVPSDKIVTSAMAGAIGEEVKLSDVLLVGSATATIVGTPTVEHSYVTAVVEEQTLADKVIVFKKKRRKNYRRRTAHRQSVTTLRIMSVNVPDSLTL